MKLVRKNNDTLVVSFDYNEQLVMAMKKLPGWRYDPNIRSWLFPLMFVREVVGALAPLGFEIEPPVYEEMNALARKVDVRAELPLFEYQKTGVKFIMENKFCFLSDEMGLGKSVQAIVACEELKLRKVLVITMSSLKINFAEEIKKWYPEAEVSIVSGNQMERSKAYMTPANYYITNYDSLRNDWLLVQRIPWEMIICDEATKIKNPNAKTTKAVKMLNAPRKVALTGTPIANTPADLWAPMDWLLPGILQSWWRFRQTYCKMDYWGNVSGYTNLDDLQKRISPYFLRRTKDEVMSELPEKTHTDIFIELSRDERLLYRAVKTEILQGMDMSALSKIDAGSINNILAKMTRLMQICDSAELVGELTLSSKVAALRDLLEGLGGEKVIVFTRFAEFARILARDFEDYHPLLVTGETPPDARQGIIKAFEEKPEHQLMISTETLAYGVNLQFCSHLVHADLPWSISKLEQREGRLDRIGAKKNITFYSLIVRNSMDEFVRKVLHAKEKTADEVMEGIKAALLD